MVNEVLDSMTRQLHSTFGKSKRYYLEDVEQDLKKPCYTVGMIAPTMRSTSPVLYTRTMPTVIHYFTDKPNSIKKDCFKIAEETIECLEYLPFKDTLLRGENISWQLTDDVLQIFITYKFTTMKDLPAEEAMENLEESVLHKQ